MNTTCLYVAILALGLANAVGQAKVLTNDPLTGFPLTPATVLFKNVGNEPDKMPDAQVCKNKMQGNLYSLSTVMNPANAPQMDATAAWYASHLSGFKKVQGYGPDRSQIAFYKPDGTVVVFLIGQPGLSEKTVTSLTQGKIVCQ